MATISLHCVIVCRTINNAYVTALLNYIPAFNATVLRVY